MKKIIHTADAVNTRRAFDRSAACLQMFVSAWQQAGLPALQSVDQAAALSRLSAGSLEGKVRAMYAAKVPVPAGIDPQAWERMVSVPSLAALQTPMRAVSQSKPLHPAFLAIMRLEAGQLVWEDADAEATANRLNTSHLTEPQQAAAKQLLAAAKALTYFGPGLEMRMPTPGGHHSLALEWNEKTQQYEPGAGFASVVLQF